MKVGKTSFYFDFLKQAQNRSEIKSLQVTELLRKFCCDTSHNNIFSSVSYLTDYVKNINYFNIDNQSKFLGYNTKDLFRANSSFLTQLRNEDDFQVFSEQIFPDEMLFLRNNKDEDFKEYSFTTNFRIRNFSNVWSFVVQRTVYLFNEFYNMPIGSLNWITDVTDFKNDSKINHLIESLDGLNNRVVVERKCYYLNNAQEILSRREMDVLKLASTGMASKEIANQLNISIHTINNHRRNMLERCNCKNILQLVDIAVKSGVI